MPEHRKFDRLPAHLDVEIRTRGRGQVCPSHNVSRHGMFLVTANPPHERQLLILRIPLPDGRPPVDVMASVVRRVVSDPQGGPTGVGINFFALTEETKGRWESYLAQLRGLVRAPDASPEHAKRATFMLQPKDADRLRLFEAREFALGSMFLRTPVLREVGETLKVILLHPLSDAEFPLLAKVRQLHQGAPGSKEDPKGMTLDFEPLEHEVRLAFHDFVEHGIGLDDDPMFATPEEADRTMAVSASVPTPMPDGPDAPRVKTPPAPPAAVGDTGAAEETPEAVRASAIDAGARPPAPGIDALLSRDDLLIPALPVEEVPPEELQIDAEIVHARPTGVPPPPPSSPSGGGALDPATNDAPDAAASADEQGASSSPEGAAAGPGQTELQREPAAHPRLEGSEPSEEEAPGQEELSEQTVMLAADSWRAVREEVTRRTALAVPPDAPTPSPDNDEASGLMNLAHELQADQQESLAEPASEEPARIEDAGDVPQPPSAVAPPETPATAAPPPLPSMHQPAEAEAITNPGAPSPAALRLEELRAAVERAPEDLGALSQLGSQLARSPTTAFEAIGLLQRLLALEPQHPLANGSLALAYAQIGQRAAAQRHFARARRLGQPIDPQLRTLLADS